MVEINDPKTTPPNELPIPSSPQAPEFDDQEWILEPDKRRADPGDGIIYR